MTQATETTWTARGAAVFEGARCIALTTTSDVPDRAQEEARARMMAAAPAMLAALKVHEEWARKEHEGPQYPPGKSRDNGGDLIWQQWWAEQLDLCDRANRLTLAAIARAEAA